MGWRWVVGCLLAVSSPGGATGGTSAPVDVPSGVATPGRQPAALPELSQLAEAALPAVVGVVTVQGERGATHDALQDVLEGFRGGTPRRGVASGFVIQPDGLVLTNAHVVEGASHVEVELGEDGERVPARVVGADAASDIALLKVTVDRPLPVLPLGDSDRLRIAEWVVVIGNPFGLAHTVTAGIVSHTGRADVAPAGRDGYYDFIQTDAPINPGNSGGPILNLRGEVVGIATAINATGQGIGFAIPVNMAKEIVPQLRERGRVVRSWMGVSVREARAASTRARRVREVVVTDVVRGGPAALGGLSAGDVITAFDGRSVASAARLRWFVAMAGVGRHVELTVRRGGAERSVDVELAASPPPDGDAAASADAEGQDEPAASGTGSLHSSPR